jgi:hypothetical protein
VERLEALLDVVYRDVVEPFLDLLDQGGVLSLDLDVPVQRREALDASVQKRDGLAHELVERGLYLAGHEGVERGRERSLGVGGPDLGGDGDGGCRLLYLDAEYSQVSSPVFRWGP